jgi:16S rRNA C967 or C1407 C5-methylase (RsmB/RsmF family)
MLERAERVVHMLGALILYGVAVAFVSAAIYVSIKNADKPAFVDPPCSAQSPAHK